MATDNREISRRVFEEIWNQKNFDVVDELMAPGYVHHDPVSPGGASGIEGYKDFVRYYLTAFPDLSFTVHDHIGDGDLIASRWTAIGTHIGDLPGIPRTGHQISVTGMTIARLQNSKLVESWSNWDALGLMQQLGVVPAIGKGQDRAA